MILPCSALHSKPCAAISLTMGEHASAGVPAGVRREVDRLRHEIADHNRRYFELDAPEIADAEYEALFRRLQELEAAHPTVRSATTPHTINNRLRNIFIALRTTPLNGWQTTRQPPP